MTQGKDNCPRSQDRSLWSATVYIVEQFSLNNIKSGLIFFLYEAVSRNSLLRCDVLISHFALSCYSSVWHPDLL